MKIHGWDSVTQKTQFTLEWLKSEPAHLYVDFSSLNTYYSTTRPFIG